MGALCSASNKEKIISCVCMQIYPTKPVKVRLRKITEIRNTEGRGEGAINEKPRLQLNIFIFACDIGEMRMYVSGPPLQQQSTSIAYIHFQGQLHIIVPCSDGVGSAGNGTFYLPLLT
jgi:hypothetical protein